MKFFFRLEVILAIVVVIGGILFYIIQSSQNDNVYNVTVVQDKEANIKESSSFKEKHTLSKESNINSTLETWLNTWDVSLDDFQKTGDSEIVYPFNEVLLDGRENRIPNFEKATSYSPDKERWVNYLYNYENKGLSGVILFNPRGEKRIFRVAFCNNYCNYHFAKWIDNNRFVIGAYKRDVESCEKEVSSIKDCPIKLFYLVYDIKEGKVQEFTHEDSFNLSQEEIDEKICPIYPPCKNE